MKKQEFIGVPFMPDLRAIAEQNDVALKRVFKGRIKGCFLIDIKDQVMKDLGLKSLMKSIEMNRKRLISIQRFISDIFFRPCAQNALVLHEV